MFGSIRNVTLFYSSKRYAGHSKWANIKHIKAAKDSQRARLFTRLCQRMKIAIQEGGGVNPDTNFHLAQVIEIAKKQNMPVSSIQSCIKSTQVDKSNVKSLWFEIKGPKGCFVIASVLTDNQRRSRDTITPILKKFQASFADRSCRHLFEHKGVIIASPPPDITNIEELAEDHAVMCGAEDVKTDESEEGALMFICDLPDLNIVTSKLQKLNYSIKSADFNFIPTTKVQLSDSDLETMSKLFDKLQDHPDVVGLYDNIA